MDTEKYCDTIRSMITHETTLRNNRLIWMMAMQGLLLAAYGALFNENFLAILVLTVTGIISSISIQNSMYICSKAITKLMQKVSGSDENSYPPVIGHYAKLRLFLPWNLLPIWFACVWVALTYIAWTASQYNP